MYRILVCDDDEAILESVAIYLKNEGYEVLTASDGVQALDVIGRNEIHCLVLDIMMPKLDGFSACKEIRKISDVPIIMLSARSEVMALWEEEEEETTPMEPLPTLLVPTYNIRQQTENLLSYF